VDLLPRNRATQESREASQLRWYAAARFTSCIRWCWRCWVTSGCPTVVELPATTQVVAPALEARAQMPASDQVARVSGGLAMAVGAALVGGAVLSIVGARRPRVRAREARPVLRAAS